MGRRRYTEEQFRDAVADATVTTIAELCRRLGIVPRGGNYASLRALARRLGIDLDDVLASRPKRIRPGRWRAPWTAGDLAVALQDPDVRSFVGVCRALGVAPRTEAYRRIRAVADEHDLDLTRLVPPNANRPVERDRGAPPDDVANGGRRPATGARGPDHPQPRAAPRGSGPAGGRARRPLSEMLQRDAAVNTSMLRKRLVEEGVLPAECASCGRTTWQDEPIPLELDHIDGDRTNNLLENLRFLCPNCHAQTPTYRGRNIGRRRQP